MDEIKGAATQATDISPSSTAHVLFTLEQEEAVNRAHWYWLGHWWREKRNRCTCAFEIAFLRSSYQRIYSLEKVFTLICSFQFDNESLKISNRFFEHWFILIESFDLWDTNYWSFERLCCRWKHIEKCSRFVCILLRMTRWQRRFINVVTQVVAVFDNDVDDCVDRFCWIPWNNIYSENLFKSLSI